MFTYHHTTQNFAITVRTTRQDQDLTFCTDAENIECSVGKYYNMTSYKYCHVLFCLGEILLVFLLWS